MAVLGPGPARSGEAIVLNAVSYHEIPSGNAVSVEIFDDSEDNLRLMENFIAELKGRGYTVSADARLILSFETRGTSGTWTGGGPNRLIELGESGDDRTGTEAPDVRVKIFNNQRGGILNPQRDPGITQVAPSEYRIDATLEDRENGRRLWQGWTAAPVGAAEDPALQQAMVGPIVEAIGETVRSKSIPIR